MSELPWVRFFPSDWLGGTRGMSAAETGIYITLVATMYERGEPIPEDHARLARLCGASNSTFKAALELLVSEGKIVRTETGLWNERVEKESVYRSEKSEVGKQAADARWRKTQQNQEADDANALHSHCDRNASQKPEARYKISDAIASDEPVDFRNELWTSGVSSVVRITGKTQSAAKSMVGKWLRDAKDDCRLLLEKIRTAETEGIGDPISWITAAIRPPPKPKTVGEIFRDDAKRMGLIPDDKQPPSHIEGRLEAGNGSREGGSTGIARRFAIPDDVFGRIG